MLHCKPYTVDPSQNATITNSVQTILYNYTMTPPFDIKAYVHTANFHSNPFTSIKPASYIKL